MVSALIWRPAFVSFKDIEATKPRFKDSPIKQWIATMIDPLLGWAVHNFLWHLTGCSAVLIVKVSGQQHPLHFTSYIVYIYTHNHVQ